MRSLLLKSITVPVAFKAIRESRRAQLWNRQASIMMDLTMSALRHAAEGITSTGTESQAQVLRPEGGARRDKGWDAPTRRRSGHSSPNKERPHRRLSTIGKAADMRTRTTDSVTTEDVLNALGRFTRESNESDRQTTTKLGINRLTLKAWLLGVDPLQRCLLARRFFEKMKLK